MDNYGGDLADIIRTGGTINASAIDIIPAESHDYDHNNSQIDQYRLGFDIEDDPLLDEFGDPFSMLLQDPLLSNNTTTHAHDHDDNDSTSFFNNVVVVGENSINQNGRRLFLAEEDLIFQQSTTTRNRDNSTSLFTRMFDDLVDSSNSTKSSAVMKTTTTTNPMLAVNDVLISNNSSINGGGMQISSPRNAGIKRRKSQCKKVVCIPAPAPVNSRPSGEVVPSDLWAWRKYGQKPIKGSPYPRGYYRCSSCKGCPARKQVERNRTDPNMLVITYTCEHNHPWPTQRNALAGSTRTTHLSRSGSGSGSNSKITPTNSTSNSQSTHKQPNTHLLQQVTNDDKLSSPPRISSSVKQEMETDNHVRFSQVFQQSAYKPGFVDDTSHTEDFFTELGELEADPMNILFPNGYSEVDDCENKSLDPFTFYDWAGNNNNNKDYLVKPEEKKGS